MSELNEAENLLELEEPDVLAEEIEFALGTVAAITSTGLRIQFDGDDSAGSKVYKCNASAKFVQGDRVKMHKESGSYIVEYVVGAPFSRYPIPPGGTDGQVLMKDGSTAYSVKWGTLEEAHGIPDGGSKDYVLTKNSATDYDVKWSKINGLPSGGSKGYALVKNTASDYDVKWQEIPDIPSTSSSTWGKYLKNSNTGLSWDTPTAANGLPTGGSAGQFLKKSSFTAYACEWATIKEYSGPTINGSGTTTLGFFGTSAATKQYVGVSGTLSQLIAALRTYGLIN